MPSGYKTTVRSLFGLFGSSLRDLDSIFKYRYSQKRPDVNFIDENGSDISNRYEKLNRFDVRITVSSTAETYERYGRNNNGTLTVKITQANYNYYLPSGTRHNYTVTVGGISKNLSFNDDTAEFKFTNLNQATYGVVVTENISGKSVRVTETLGGPAESYSLTALQL